METNILGMVGLFIAAAIMLGIGTLILGGAVTDCTTVSDYVAANDDDGVTADHNQSGWAAQCFINANQSQAGYNLLIVVLIVIAAVIVLAVVRMLA